MIVTSLHSCCEDFMLVYLKCLNIVSDSKFSINVNHGKGCLLFCNPRLIKYFKYTGV